MNSLDVVVAIMSDGTRTVAEATLVDFAGSEGVISGAGSAGRDHEDKFKAQAGEDLATARALRSLAARLERRALGTIKHAADIRVHRAEIAERKAAEEEGLRSASEFLADVNPWGTSAQISPPHDF